MYRWKEWKCRGELRDGRHEYKKGNLQEGRTGRKCVRAWSSRKGRYRKCVWGEEVTAQMQGCQGRKGIAGNVRDETNGGKWMGSFRWKGRRYKQAWLGNDKDTERCREEMRDKHFS